MEIEQNQYLKNGKDMTCQFMEFLENCSADFDHAVTLTFTHEPPDIINAFSACRHFCNRLNRAIFGNNWRRKAKNDIRQRIAIIPVIEGQPNSEKHGQIRLHYHMAISRPEHLTTEELTYLIEKCWRKTKYAGNSVAKHTSNADFDWIRYISKTFETTRLYALDAESLHVY